MKDTALNVYARIRRRCCATCWQDSVPKFHRPNEQMVLDWFRRSLARSWRLRMCVYQHAHTRTHTILIHLFNATQPQRRPQNQIHRKTLRNFSQQIPPSKWNATLSLNPGSATPQSTQCSPRCCARERFKDGETAKHVSFCTEESVPPQRVLSARK